MIYGAAAPAQGGSWGEAQPGTSRPPEAQCCAVGRLFLLKSASCNPELLQKWLLLARLLQGSDLVAWTR